MVEKRTPEHVEWKPKKSQVLMQRDDDGFPVPQGPKSDSISINGREILITDLSATLE